MKRMNLFALGTEFPMSFVYIIIEGCVEAFRIVERALTNGSPET